MGLGGFLKKAIDPRTPFKATGQALKGNFGRAAQLGLGQPLGKGMPRPRPRPQMAGPGPAQPGPGGTAPMPLPNGPGIPQPPIQSPQIDPAAAGIPGAQQATPDFRLTPPPQLAPQIGGPYGGFNPAAQKANPDEMGGGSIFGRNPWGGFGG